MKQSRTELSSRKSRRSLLINTSTKQSKLRVVSGKPEAQRLSRVVILFGLFLQSIVHEAEFVIGTYQPDTRCTRHEEHLFGHVTHIVYTVRLVVCI